MPREGLVKGWQGFDDGANGGQNRHHGHGSKTSGNADARARLQVQSPPPHRAHAKRSKGPRRA
eukprot:5137567-Alexandrium_andersonii.AAC.1